MLYGMNNDSGEGVQQGENSTWRVDGTASAAAIMVLAGQWCSIVISSYLPVNLLSRGAFYHSISS